MKKLLLLITAAAFSASAIAQSAPKFTPRVDARNASKMTPDNLLQNQNSIPRVNAVAKAVPHPVKRGQPSGNHTQQNVPNVVTLGKSANAFGNFYIGHQELTYNKDINTVTLFHRNEPVTTGDPNTGYYRYDKSTDGGSTWSNEQGPVYGPVLSPAGQHNGRYPVGTLSNPVGNNNPNAASEVYTGVWHVSSVWHGDVWGMGKLDGSAHTENYDSTNGAGNMWWVDDIWSSKQNIVWRIGAVLIDNQGAYQDTMKVDKGVWNGSDYVYTTQYLYFHSNSLLSGTRPYDANIRFSDDGMIGYAVVIGNGDEGDTTYPTGVFYMQMYITTDGGNTWVGDPRYGNPNKPLDVALVDSGATSGSLVGQQWFGNPDSTFTVTAFGLTTNDPRPDFNMTVDNAGNLHIFVGVYPGSGFAVTQSDPGTFGVADIYTTDHGTHWFGQLVGKPYAYTGNYGDYTSGAGVQEGNRPYISRSWDGSKLFYSWFDTDPNLYGTNLNDFPDVYVTGYDVASSMWTPIIRADSGCGEEGLCQFGLVSPWVKDNACTYTVPVAVMNMENTTVSSTTGVNGVCDYFYLDGINLSCSDFTVTAPNPPILLRDFTLGVNHAPAPSHFAVSSNYPNPFNGHTYVDVTLSASADVTIEVSNMMGQVISTRVYQNLSAGKNKLDIDGSNLAKGVYVYKVMSGNDVVTKTMTVR